jgi:uncharacterized protein (TIGR00251 family)
MKPNPPRKSAGGPAQFVIGQPGGVCLSLKVQPRASKNEIGEVAGNELKVKITAPPVDSAANEALICFLAQVLDCPRSALRLIRGQASRHKKVMVFGMNVEGVLKKLAAE